MVCNDGLNQDMTGNKDDFEELHNDDETEIVQHNTDWRWQHLPRGSVRVYAGVLYLLSPYPIVVICHLLSLFMVTNTSANHSGTILLDPQQYLEVGIRYQHNHRQHLNII